MSASAESPPISLSAGGPSARSAAFARLKKRRRSIWVYLVPILVVLVLFGIWFLRRTHVEPGPRYLTARVTRGPLIESVRATGAVQPVLQVQVGAQVSGRLATVKVDYNSRVKSGDLLAEIDPIPYRAQVAQARATLMSARAQLAQSKANLVLAEQNLQRQQKLREQSLNAPSDLDSAVASRDAARAAVGVAEAQVAQSDASLTVAQANLDYTRILAPIDGIVATRSIDPGQTVAASFQTPTLFVIANDLTHMRVIANVDEANIGKLKEGLAATARVDAFPRDTFNGTLSELRINPTTTNGVVTYQAVIDVANPESRLRPGMTATITVVTARQKDVLRVPNAALRYDPSPATATQAMGSGPTAASPATPSPDDDQPGRGSLYLSRGGNAALMSVNIGVTDGVFTEVQGPDLAVDEEVIVDETDASGAPRPNAPRMRMF